MLPNWLLGKSKSKLIEELGGGGGGTSYTAGDGIDISSGVISFDPSTTPVIDPSKIDGLDDDLAALAPKTAISNPNILHNPWFQVNQRKVASVNTSDEFVVDRWKSSIIGNSSGTFTVNSDSTITIANTSASSSDTISLYQKRTDRTFDRLKGRKVTLSVMLSDGTIYSGTGVVPHSGVTQLLQNEDIVIGIDETENKFFKLHVYGGKTITIKALKFEVGEISTLAMDTAPDMAIELLKCQRYFQRIKSSVSGQTVNLSIGTAVTATQIIVPISIAPMRATPTLTYSLATLKSPQTGGSLTPTGFGINTAGTNAIMLYANYSGGSITAGSPWYLQLGAGGYIDFSAEL